MQLLLLMLLLLLLMLLLLLLLLLKLHGYSVCSCCCDASRHRCDAGFAAPAVSSLRDAAPSGCCQTQLIVWYRIEQPLPEASEVLPHVPAPTQQPLAPGPPKVTSLVLQPAPTRSLSVLMWPPITKSWPSCKVRVEGKGLGFRVNHYIGSRIKPLAVGAKELGRLLAVLT